MTSYKEEFIHFMIDSGVLRFGDFVTKSGRETPFFINAGNFSTGEQLNRLGEFYAGAIKDEFDEEIKKGFDVIFGPAYKGIPLATTTAAALSRLYNINVRFASDRKEIKDHGEGGKLLGGPINEGDRVLIIEDVTTAGTSIKETYPIIKANGASEAFGLIIACDRMEKGDGEISAIKQIEKDYGIVGKSIVNMAEVVECLYNREYCGKVFIDDNIKSRIDSYYERYGAGYFG